MIISSQLNKEQEKQLLDVLRWNEQAIGWTLADLRGLDPSLCTHRIFLEDESRPVREAQRRLNPKVWEAVKEEILKWLNAEIIYPISDSQWVSPVHVVPKKARVTVTVNDKGEEIQTRLPTKWQVCIDYRKLNAATKKDHFPLPFIDQILDQLAGQTYFCFLNGYSRYNQIAVHPDDQEKTTYTCPFGTFAFRRMPFKQRAVSSVASVGPGLRRVESVRESFRSTSLQALGHESSRGARQSTRRVDHGRNPINSSILSAFLNPDGGGDGAGDTERNIDFDVK